MRDYEYVKVLKEDTELIRSYDRLTQEVFCFDLENWRKAGLWEEQYFPNTFVVNNRIIANISASVMQLQLNNKEIKAIQLGAVGVLPEYRGTGLGRELMERVLEEYRDFPLIFLFASDDVSKFYLKCGFRRVNEIIPYINIEDKRLSKVAAKIAIDSEPVGRLLKSELQHSSIIDARGNESIYRFHLLYNFSYCLYYIADKDIIFIADYEGEVVNLYDVMSEKKVDFDEIKDYVMKENTRQIRFQFTPDWLNVSHKVMPDTDNSIYVYGEFLEDMANCRFPRTSIT